MKFILASASPRRRELLKQLIPQFEIRPSRFEEVGAGAAHERALAFARGKARDVAADYPHDAVLGSDTVVCLEEKILGKPVDAEDAKATLRLLSGRTHSVYTGVCLIVDKKENSDVVRADVTFEELSDEMIDAYVATGLPLDKAGAYGIQDGYPLVKSYEGSLSSIIGLPVERLSEMLREAKLLF